MCPLLLWISVTEHRTSHGSRVQNMLPDSINKHPGALFNSLSGSQTCWGWAKSEVSWCWPSDVQGRNFHFPPLGGEGLTQWGSVVRAL